MSAWSSNEARSNYFTSINLTPLFRLSWSNNTCYAYLFYTSNSQYFLFTTTGSVGFVSDHPQDLQLFYSYSSWIHTNCWLIHWKDIFPVLLFTFLLNCHIRIHVWKSLMVIVLSSHSRSHAYCSLLSCLLSHRCLISLLSFPLKGLWPYTAFLREFPLSIYDPCLQSTSGFCLRFLVSFPSFTTLKGQCHLFPSMSYFLHVLGPNNLPFLKSRS